MMLFCIATASERVATLSLFNERSCNSCDVDERHGDVIKHNFNAPLAPLSHLQPADFRCRPTVQTLLR